jgi:hypothetical protein
VDGAQAVGLVDEVCDLELLLEQAELKMGSLLKASDYIIRDAKRVMRRSILDSANADMSASIERRTDYWMSAESRNRIGAFVAHLKARS